MANSDLNIELEPIHMVVTVEDFVLRKVHAKLGEKFERYYWLPYYWVCSQWSARSMNIDHIDFFKLPT